MTAFDDASTPNALERASTTATVHLRDRLGGKAGFEAVPFPGYEGELFFVVAADSEAALGIWAMSSGMCPVPGRLAAGRVPPR
ncbi:MAG: hypothetical protein WCI05_05295 [Myxococcales bacterium]